MNFFFSNLGSCYRPTGLVKPQADVSNTSTTQMTLEGGGDGGVHRPYNSRRNKKLISKSSAAHWRPTLSVISEDGVVATFEREGQSKKKSPPKGRSAAKTRCFRSGNEYDHDIRKSSMAMILPTVSPTPFLF